MDFQGALSPQSQESDLVPIDNDRLFEEGILQCEKCALILLHPCAATAQCLDCNMVLCGFHYDFHDQLCQTTVDDAPCAQTSPCTDLLRGETVCHVCHLVLPTAASFECNTCRAVGDRLSRRCPDCTIWHHHERPLHVQPEVIDDTTIHVPEKSRRASLARFTGNPSSSAASTHHYWLQMAAPVLSNADQFGVFHTMAHQENDAHDTPGAAGSTDAMPFNVAQYPGTHGQVSAAATALSICCLLYTSPSPRD